MVLRYCKGNVLDKGYDVVLHQANCLNIMGGGVAREIKNRFYSAYEADRDYEVEKGSGRLGLYSYSKVCHDKSGEDFYIVNIYGQDRISGKGPKGDGVLTNYEMLEKGLYDSLVYMLNKYNIKSVGVPYKIGCGLAKGDWNIVKSILEDVSNKLGVEICVVDYNNV